MVILSVRYKLIHSGAACLTKNFINVADTFSGPQPMYFLTNLLQVTHLDLIQCYEVMKYFDSPGQEEIIGLYDQYEERVPLEAILDLE